MKNVILILLFSSLTYCLYTQSTKSASVGLLYSNLSGLSAELRYSNMISKRIGVSGRLAYNFQESYGVRLGLFYRVLDSRLIDLDLGLEYSYKHHSVPMYSEEIRSHNLEIPILLNYSLTDKYSLYGGMTSSINLNNAESSRLKNNLRIGLKYTW